jgi:hypothetical protein
MGRRAQRLKGRTMGLRAPFAAPILRQAQDEAERVSRDFGGAHVLILSPSKDRSPSHAERRRIGGKRTSSLHRSPAQKNLAIFSPARFLFAR